MTERDYNHQALSDAKERADKRTKNSPYAVIYVVVNYSQNRFAVMSMLSAIFNGFKILYTAEANN